MISNQSFFLYGHVTVFLLAFIIHYHIILFIYLYKFTNDKQMLPLHLAIISGSDDTVLIFEDSGKDDTK